MLTTTPRRISTPVLALADRLVPEGKSAFVAVRTAEGVLPNECFGNVKAQVAKHGGAIVHGWVFWEWPAVMLEAEFHAVWQTPAGELVDIAPRPNGEYRILFLADPAREFQGRQINNVRVPLRDDPLVHDYIAAADQFFEVMNRGERAEQFGAVAIPADEILPLLRRKRELQERLAQGTPSRNSLCWCGSGRKFKRCCGGT